MLALENFPFGEVLADTGMSRVLIFFKIRWLGRRGEL
jgi:hypothetical protein